jgi:transmembrane sensor
MTRDEDAAKRTEIAAYWAARLPHNEDVLDSGAEDAALAHWLEADPRNAEALAEVTQAWDLVDRLADHPGMDEMRRAALGQLAAAEPAPTPTPRVRIARHWRLIAASIALLIAIGAVPFWFLVPTTYATMTGERRVVTLSDGSRLSLDADTVVKTSYSQERRMFWLERGRAKFKVAADPMRPFTVTAGDKIVIGTGTEFSVERLGNRVLVVLYQGRVSLMEKTADCTCEVPVVPGSKVAAANYLSPAHQIVLAEGPAASDARAAIGTVDPERATAWESGMLAFKDEPLGQVVDRFNRYARKPLATGDSKAARLRISGTFDASDVDGFVEGLQTVFNVRARPEDDAVKLYLEPAKQPAPQ